MKIFENVAVLWFVAGFVLFLLEFIVPGLILFFFGVGAWIVAILSLFVDLSINTQIILFLAAAVITIVLFRRSMKNFLWTRKQSSEIEDEFIGKTGIADTLIAPGQIGKVSFKGTTWDASSEDTILPGEHVTIIGNESILLLVKSTKPL
jgi:membrane protein implicated in regulation of membrane protease activity